MKTIVTIMFSAICIIFSASCSNQKNKTTAKVIDSTLYVTKDIKLYDNIDTLLQKGILSPSVTGASKYVANNGKLMGIDFQEVDVNFDVTNSDSLRNIAYGIYTSIDTLQALYSNIYQKLLHKYHAPNKSKSPTLDGDKVSNAIWYKKGMVVILNSTIPDNEPKGTICVIFTAPKDTIYYEALMH